MNSDLDMQQNCDTALAVYDIDILCHVSIYIIKNWALLLKGI